MDQYYSHRKNQYCNLTRIRMVITVMSRLVLGSLIVHQVLVILARVDLVCGRSGLFFVSPLLFLRALLIFASTPRSRRRGRRRGTGVATRATGTCSPHLPRRCKLRRRSDFLIRTVFALVIYFHANNARTKAKNTKFERYTVMGGILKIF